MDLGMLLFGGFLVGLATMFHALKMGIKRIAGYDIFVDLSLSFLLMILFHGSTAGMFFAMMGGLFISVSLRMIRWFIGYEKIGIYQVPYKLMPFVKLKMPRVVWFYYPPHPPWKPINLKPARIPIL